MPMESQWGIFGVLWEVDTVQSLRLSKPLFMLGAIRAILVNLYQEN